jgi:hypothetical protein
MYLEFKNGRSFGPCFHSGLLIFFLMPSAYASGNIEPDALSIRKTYVSGNLVEMICKPNASDTCEINVLIEKHKASYRVKFGEYNIQPKMSKIHLYPASQTNFSILTDIYCNDEHLAAAGEAAQDVECLAHISIDNKNVFVDGIRALPISNTKIYFKPKKK